MPSHRTKKELEELKRKNIDKSQKVIIQDLFPESLSIEHPMTERIIEKKGHKWLNKSYGNHEEFWFIS